jgi:hypothetical protein
MLASMILALASSHAAPAFNGLYFATIATVIPVLFLALAVQGGSYDGLLRLALRTGRGQRSGEYPVRFPAAGRGSVSLRQLPRIMMGIAVLILVAGFWGEADSVLSLYLQRDSRGSGVVVLVATLVLAFAVVMGPLTSYVTAADQLSDLPEAGDRAASGGYGYGPGDGESSRPATGEADAG